MRISDWSSDVCSSDLLLLVVEVGVAVTEVDDARVAAAVGAGAGAAELPGLDLVGAPGGDGLPRLAQELGYLGIVHARTGLGDVAGAVEQRHGFGNPCFLARLGHAQLRMVVRHAPILEAPHVAACCVEPLA